MDTHRGTSILYTGALTVTPPGTCKPGTRPLQGRGETEPTDTTEAPLRVRHRGETLPRRPTHKDASGGTTQKAAIPVGYGELGSTPHEHIKEHGGPPPPGIRLWDDRRALSGGPPNSKMLQGLSTQRPARKPSESRQG